MEKTLEITSLMELDQLARRVATQLSSGNVVGLSGELGSGKTTFTKALARHLNVKETVNSPTFTLLKIYQGTIPFYHIDAYRLEESGYDPSLDDYIFGQGVAIIEWYPIIRQELPDSFLSVDFLVTGPTSRKVTVKGSGEYAKIVETLGD